MIFVRLLYITKHILAVSIGYYESSSIVYSSDLLGEEFIRLQQQECTVNFGEHVILGAMDLNCGCYVAYISLNTD